MAKRRSSNSLRRSVGSREPKKRVVVVCEGSKTEPEYLKQLNRRTKSALVELVLEDSDATSPKQLVERASYLLKTSQKEARRTKDVNAKADEVWCVFDIDEHPYLIESVQQAKANGVFLAISNPSIELWFLMHFEDCFAYIHRDSALKRLENYLDYEKGAFALYPFLGNFDAARDRSQRLDVKHEGDQTDFPHNNPSSGVWRLVESLDAHY